MKNRNIHINIHRNKHVNYNVFEKLLSVIRNHKKISALVVGLTSISLISWYSQFNPLSLLEKTKPSISESTNKEPGVYTLIYTLTNLHTLTNVINTTNFVVKEIIVTNNTSVVKQNLKNSPTTNVIIYIHQDEQSSPSNKFRNRSLNNNGYYIRDEQMGGFNYLNGYLYQNNFNPLK